MNDDSHFAEDEGFDIAIVGMAGRFPGADSIDEYWDNLVQGVESISTFTDDELRAAGIDEASIADPNYVKAAPKLKTDAAGFDAAFFGYSPREAQFMDPQHRVFLETAWHALEHAGYATAKLDIPVGVFGGAAMNTYFMRTHLSERFDSEYLQTLIGNDNSFLATRVSYKLDLGGPSMTVQTACSTSLVAVHQAGLSLLNDECDLAIAGGVSVRVPQVSGYLYQDGSVASPDGHCRTFDSQAAGTLFGSGVGIVVLKRLKDAIADGDTVHAVIKGSAINNDGSSKVDYTAPSVSSQADVIAEALSVAGVSADSISYVEAHGTGTYLGDPIEIAALTKAFRADTDDNGFCAIGSVKTNIGHLDAAAGVAGLIKTVFALKHRRIPASLHFESPNPQIDFDNSPFYVNDELRDWKTDDEPRRAGITSLGIGGTNAHIVLEEPPALPETSPSRRHQLVVWSARSEAARDATAAELSDALAATPHALADIAFTLQTGRRAFPYRGFAVSKQKEHIANLLRVRPAGQLFQAHTTDQHRDVAFLFSGQGAQYPNMTRDLYEQEPFYRETIDNCLNIADRELARLADATRPSLRELVFPSADGLETVADQLRQTSITQPALFAIEYSIARLLMHWGIQPAALAGHSIGEYVAACLAGVFNLETAMRLVVKRGYLMQSMPSGAMLAALCPEEDVNTFLPSSVSLAVVNGPSVCVVAGSHDDIDALKPRFDDAGIEYRSLRTSHAFHSSMMDPILEEFTKAVAEADPQRPALPIASNVTGEWMTVQEAVDPNYWARQLRSTVRFHDCLTTLLAEPDRVLVEVGPGNTLASLAKQHPNKQRSHTVVATCRHIKEEVEDDEFMVRAIGQLWMAGINIDWKSFYGDELRRRVPLPVYPFERKRHWYKAKSAISDPTRVLRRAKLQDWVYAPSWTRSLVQMDASTSLDGGNACLIISDDQALARSLQDAWQVRGGETYVAVLGEKYSQIDKHRFAIRGQASDFHAVLNEISQTLSGRRLQVFYVATTRGITGQDDAGRFYELLDLSKALNAWPGSNLEELRLCVAAESLAQVFPGEGVNVAQSLLLGPARVLPKESSGVQVSIVDVPFSKMDSNEVAACLVHESCRSGDGEIVAVRGAQRWRQAFEPLPLERPAAQRSAIQRHGVYIITGGLGGVGLALAQHLAREYAAKLVLVGRTPLPARDEWNQILADEETGPQSLREKLVALRELEELGSEVLTLSADVSDASHVATLEREVADRFGELDGIFHVAGNVRDSLMELKSVQEAEEVIAPKVAGTRNLLSLAKSLQPDFMVLFSSVNAVLAPAGQCDYASANAYADAVANAGTQETRLLSINWPGWQDVGMLSRAEASTWRSAALQRGIKSSQGMELLERALLQTVSDQLLVSPVPFEFPSRHYEVEDTVEVSASGDVDAVSAVTESGDTGAEYSSATEQAIASLWTDLLGVEHPQPTDDYFDLGGSSLLATQMIARIQTQMSAKLSIREVLDNPTISQLARVVEAKANASVESRSVPDAELPPSVDVDTLPPAAGIPMRDRSARCPLSTSQERMWYMNKLYPDSLADNLPLGYRLSGPLDMQALRRSIAIIVERHEILRTVFSEDESGPVQIVRPDMKAEVTESDLRATPVDHQEEALQEGATQAARHPFDLETGPLFQVHVFHLSDEDHVLLFNMHHIICDGWSYAVLEDELEQCYASLARGEQPSFSAPPLQYGDYASWEKDQLRRADEESDYWMRTLSADSPPTEIPSEKTRPAMQTFEGAKHHFCVPATSYQKMKALCQEERSTTFMAMLSALNSLVFRYTGMTDLVIGSPVSLRDRDAMKSGIGIFLNMLALRTQFESAVTGRELLRRVRETTLDGQAHQGVPFNHVVEQLQVPTDPSRLPLFQIMLQVSPSSQLRLDGLQSAPFAFDSNTAQYDLAFHLYESETGLHGHIEYNTALYQEAEIDRLAGHFSTLVEGLVTEPDVPVVDLKLLTDQEHELQVVSWNSTSSDDEIHACIHDVFRQKARECPERVAVESRDGQLTYAQLDAESDRLATYLRSRGVSDGSFVGVCLERSSSLMVALLGILKSGGAYIPLDPSFPHDRLAYMLEDSGARVCVTQNSLLPLPFDHGAETIAIDGDWRSAPVDDCPLSQGEWQNPAYIIYTSGSTGRPKGVQIGHKAAVNFLKSMAHEPGMDADDVCLAITTLSFDIALLELFLPLFVGAKTYVVSKEDALDGQRLAELIEQTSTSVMQATPATWQMLLDNGWVGVQDRSFKALCGGEPLPLELSRELVQRSSELWNMYGPTETTVWSTISKIEPGTEKITVGRPIRNTDIYILDSQMRPVPIGVPGVLYIGGEGLADRYHDRPELTAEKFVRHPFSQDPTVRIYNTGDLARYTSAADGTIEHLGRIDGQVKIRGFRIELGEIESVLLSFPGVERAVVVDKEDRGEKFLVGYFVAPESVRPSVTELRRFLGKSLPDYMIPSAFMALDAIPLTPNKKVDRRALPVPETLRPELDHEYIAARNGIETQLVEIWERILKRSPIGIRDSFFDLGGNSLKAIQLFNSIEATYGRRLSLASLFQTPTIETLASRISTLEEAPETAQTWKCLVPIQTGGSQPHLYFIHAAGGHVMLYQNVARHLGGDFPVYGLQSLGLDGENAPQRTIEEMATRYLEEIRSHQPHGPYHLAGYCLGGTIAIEMACQLRDRGEEVGLLGLIETYNWVRLGKMSMWDRARFTYEQIQFHTRNVLMLTAKDRRAFLQEKWEVAKQRLGLKLASLWRRATGEASSVEDNVRRLNHSASFCYEPRHFDGKITHFRPRREYKVVQNPRMYWDNIASRGVDSVTLTAFPAGTLMDPYAAEIAEAIRSRLSGRDDQAGEIPAAPATVGIDS